MSVRVKGERLLRDGRVHLARTLVANDGTEVRRFNVDGDNGTYEVRWDPYGMKCTCPARVRCSHEIAVVLWAQKYRIHDMDRGNVVDGDETKGEG